MNIKEFTLTEKLLKDLNACEDGISFAKRNKLIGFPLSHLNEINGDYKEYVNWLRSFVDIKYDFFGNLIEIEKTNRLILKYEYDSFGKLIRVDYPYDFYKKFEYDSFGRLIRVDYADDVYKKLEYDSFGRLIRVDYPYDFYKKFEYDSFGREILYEEAPNYWEKYEYDNLGRKISFLNSINLLKKYEYDEIGNLIHLESKTIQDEYKIEKHNDDYFYDCYELSYDSHYNIISITYHLSTSTTATTSTLKNHTTFYENGQLKSFNDLIIPRF